MSNFLAIATVTATLKDLLYASASKDVTDPRVVVSTLRPDIAKQTATDTEATINIYLYQVTPNAALSNADLPTRRPDGTLLQRPQVALDLHYMISFYGAEGDFVTHRLLGSVARTLHAEPQLTRARIRATIPNVLVNGNPILLGSNLADQVELVKFTPLHLSLEELSKIWSVFYQIPYVLSVAYQGTVVLIESDDAPQSTLPVRARNVYVVPFNQPIIEQVIEQSGANQPNQPDPPITVNSTLLIRGKRLRGEMMNIQVVQANGPPVTLLITALVRVNGIDVPIESQNMSDTQITFPLNATVLLLDGTTVALTDRLRSGVQGLQVIQPRMMGTPPVPHSGVESNVEAFVLRPTPDLQGATHFPATGDVSILIQPAVSRGQRVVLLLNQFSPTPRTPGAARPPTYTIVAEAMAQQWQQNPDGEETTTSIIFSLQNIQPGIYLVRVQVAGAESLLSVDANGRYTQPQVTIP